MVLEFDTHQRSGPALLFTLHFMLTLLTRVCIALIVTLAFCMRSSSVNATNLPSYYYSFQRPTVTTHILHQGHEDKIRVNTIAMITLRIEKGFQNLLEKYNLSDIHLMVRIGYAGLPVGSTQICTEYEQNCSDVFFNQTSHPVKTEYGDTIGPRTIFIQQQFDPRTELDLVDITLANLDTFLQKMYPTKAAKPGRQIKEKMYVPLTLKKLPLNFNVYINEKDEYIIQKVQNNTAYIVPGMVTPVFIHPRFLVDINADRISVLDIDSMSLSSINLPFLPDRSEIYPSDIRHGGDFLVRSYKLITSNHMHLYHFYTVSVGAGANITLSSIPLSTDMNAHILSSGYIDNIPTYADGGPPDQFGILPYLNGAYMYMSGSMRPKVIHVPDSLRGLIHEPIPLVPLEIFPTAIKSDNDLLNLYSDAAKGIYKDASPFSPNFRIVWWLVPLVVLGGGMYGIIWRKRSQSSRTEIESTLRKQ